MLGIYYAIPDNNLSTFYGVQHKVDEAQLRKEIKMCIQNVRAIRSGLFTPDQAFEEVVRSQIVKLKVKLLSAFTSTFFIFYTWFFSLD